MSHLLRPPPSVEESVRRIRARNEAIHAFVTTRLEAAELRAAEVASRAKISAIAGLPYSLKDMWDTAGLETTGGSFRYRNRVPLESAPIHQVLEAAGAVLVGKTNASDMGLAMESQSYVGGVTANPHDLSRTAGGSSGGAAAAVADRMVAFDWGSDFGGSIRIPAAFCGVYGLRLSSEAWPVVGHFPQPPEVLRYMNGQGPIAARLDVLRDVIRIAAPRLKTGNTRKFELRGAFIYEPGRASGRWPSFVEDVKRLIGDVCGSVRFDHGLPSLMRATMIAHGMYSAHLSHFFQSDRSVSLLGGFLAVLSSVVFRGRFGDMRFHPRTGEMLLLTALLRATLHRDEHVAQTRAKQFRDDVAALFDRGYVIVLPTSTFPAPRHGQVLRTWQLGFLNMPGNVADVTALAVPFGAFEDGLPRSLQLWGPPGSEEVLIEIAARLAKLGVSNEASQPAARASVSA